MLTCLCDALYGEVGIATVKVLEAAGCEVLFDEQQTCCGQPPFNAGDWEAARSMATRCRSLFSGDEPVVVPSGSCTAMLHEGFSLLFPGESQPRAFELSQFLVQELGMHTWPARKPYEKRVAFHRSCHGRMLGLHDEAISLLASVPGIELVEFEAPEQCCGFGGAFCVTQGHLSKGIGLEKLRTIVDSDRLTVQGSQSASTLNPQPSTLGPHGSQSASTLNPLPSTLGPHGSQSASTHDPLDAIAKGSQRTTDRLSTPPPSSGTREPSLGEGETVRDKMSDLPSLASPGPRAAREVGELANREGGENSSENPEGPYSRSAPSEPVTRHASPVTPPEVASGDMGCLMHLSGLSQRHGLGLTFRHYAEILAEVLDP